jgi:hypothetical protein
LLEGVVAPMNEARDVLRHGHVLIRGGRVVAVWDGPIPPAGIDLNSVARPDLGPNALIYTGLINLHGHPLNEAPPLWQTPSSHAQAAAGRPTGTEPYANRYQLLDIRRTSTTLRRSATPWRNQNSSFAGTGPADVIAVVDAVVADRLQRRRARSRRRFDLPQ